MAEVYLTNPETGAMDTVDEETGELISRSTPLVSTQATRYSEKLRDEICDLILHGNLLHKIARIAHMPTLHTMKRWLDKHEDFKEHYINAEKFRAQVYADKAVETGELAVEEASIDRIVDARRHQFNAYKWGAEVGDPGKFSPRTKVSGDEANPVRWVIEMGVRRGENFNRDETALIKEAEEGPKKIEE